MSSGEDSTGCSDCAALGAPHTAASPPAAAAAAAAAVARVPFCASVVLGTAEGVLVVAVLGGDGGEKTRARAQRAADVVRCTCSTAMIFEALPVHLGCRLLSWCCPVVDPCAACTS
eukprot:512852-Pelagomonas_calceolata.AAC.3